jgi:DNA-binding NarL/FixJ family response regulator
MVQSVRDRIRVGVFDEHEIFRRGVVTCLEEDSLLEVVTSAERPVAIEIDVGVVSPDALDADVIECPVVVCAPATRQHAGLRDRPLVMAVLSRHAVGPAQLTSAVRAAAVGLRVADPDIGRLDVTDRVTKVLGMLADGAGTREISTALGYSERTIKGVIADIQHDFNARTRTQAVAEALRRHVI